MVVYARESPTFSVENYNWLSANIVFVQIQIQSEKQYITCTLHYIVEYTSNILCTKIILLKVSKLMVPFLRAGLIYSIIVIL